jgi:hypothetical protein
MPPEKPASFLVDSANAKFNRFCDGHPDTLIWQRGL